MVKNLPTMQKTKVQTLNLEDCLENGMATHSNMLAGQITGTEKPVWATVPGVTKSWTPLSTFHFT